MFDLFIIVRKPSKITDLRKKKRILMCPFAYGLYGITIGENQTCKHKNIDKYFFHKRSFKIICLLLLCKSPQ